jgi:hypothetical protein
MKRMRLTALVALGTLALGLRPAVARADDVEQAKMYFDAGAQAYSAGRYAVAVSAFDLAYKLAPRPAILFSMAQAERKQWSVARQPEVVRSAVRHYHQYLDLVPTGGRRTDAADALSELEPMADRLGPTADPKEPPAPASATRLMISSTVATASASIDGGQKTETPLMETVTPGKHKVTLSAPGYFDETRDVVALAGAVVPTEIALKEKPARLDVSAEGSGDIAVDGRVVGTTPLPRPLEIASGVHLVSVSRNGYRAFSRDVTLARDKTSRLDVPFERTTQRWVSYATFGFGLAAVAAGGTFVGVALVEQGNAQKVLDDKARGNISSGELGTYPRSIDLRDGWRTAATASLGVGVAALAAGAFLYAFDRPGIGEPPPHSDAPPAAPAKPRDMEMSAAPLLGPGVVGATWVGRF